MAKKTVKVVTSNGQQELIKEAAGYWNSVRAVISGKNLPDNLSDISVLVRDPIKGFDYDAIRFEFSARFLAQGSLRATLLNSKDRLVLIINKGRIYPRGAHFANFEDGYVLRAEVLSRLVPVIDSLAPVLVETAGATNNKNDKE